MDKEIEARQAYDQFESLIEGLMAQKYGCCDDFLDPHTIDGLRINLERSQALGALLPAGIGKEVLYQRNELVRGDQIKWLEKENEDEFEMRFLKKIEDFIQHLNQTCYTSIRDFEAHYASYPKNSFYKKHLDQFKNDRGRKFSVILYLNKGWTSEDGGLLSLYPKGGDQVDLSPLAGRLVFFRSDELVHEVHPSRTRERKSIAGWMKG